MTHSLHRFGRQEDLTGDFIVFAMPARGVNDANAVEVEKAFLRLALKHDPVNIGDAKKGGWYQPQIGLGPSVHWRRDTSPNPQRVIDGIDARGIVTAVFDGYEKMAAFVKELVDADLGVSINISALARRAADCCRECGITRHSVEYSLGFQGRTDKLPEKDVLELSTMCGHGTVSFGLAAKMLERVKSGRRSPREAARTLARFCVCSIFNPARAEEIFRRRAPGSQSRGPMKKGRSREGAPPSNLSLDHKENDMLGPVVKEAWVEGTPEEAFRRFTEEVHTWWPTETHSVSLAECQFVSFKKEPEPSDANGFIVVLTEEDLEGREHVWGTCQIWDPPYRFVTSWHPGRGPAEAQEVEVIFQEKDGGTTVRLTHRAWEALGNRAAEVRARYDSGWQEVLELFAGSTE